MATLKKTVLAVFLGGIAFGQQTGNSTECLEAVSGSGCQLRWVIQASSATAKSGVSTGSATPSLLAFLDYQWRAPYAPRSPASAQTFADCFTAHLIFRTGYTQSMIATRVLPAAASGSASSTVTALLQPAFETGAASTMGWTIGRNGQGGVFAELGFGARASFDDLIPSNQIVENGGGTALVDLSANNPQTLVGLYEATAHFHVSSWNHNQPAPSSGAYANVSDLLTIEAGYQDNSGLAQLIPASPQTNTRIRFLGRVSLNPEIPNSSHTQLTLGMEFSGGLNGGPKIVQIFAGTNLNPAKIFSAH